MNIGLALARSHCELKEISFKSYSRGSVYAAIVVRRV